MDILDFIRLVKRNLVLLVMMPLFSGIITIFLTRKLDIAYTSTTVLYTGLATGFNIESTGEMRKDQFVVNNSFENLLNTIRSRETLKEVSFKLLADILAENNIELNDKTKESLSEWLNDPQFKKLTVPANAELTFQNLEKAYQNQSSSRLVELFNEAKTPFSLKLLSEIKATRKGSSDMIEISYMLTDRALSDRTLKYTLEVFMRRYKGLKQSETGNVVSYFQEQLATAKADLNQAEDRMKYFRENGQILNYYEQTKALAGKKEDITDERSRLAGELEAADNALLKLEQKLAINRDVFFKNNDLLAQRNKIAQLTSEIARTALNPERPTNEATLNEVKNYENTLIDGVKKLYGRTHSTENIQVKSLLDSWLENMIMVEKNKARLKTLNGRLGEIKDDYERFAPLGSGLSRLEREINVHEKAYIQILHDLNLALLRKQNIELSSNLEVIDNPITLQQPGKRAMLVILASLMTVILIISTLVAAELFDQTIKTPQRAIQMIGLNSAGVFPFFNTIKDSELLNTLAGQLNTNWRIAMPATSRTPVIMFTSTQNSEGKSFISDTIATHLRRNGANILSIQPTENTSTSFENNVVSYPKNKPLAELKSIKELTGPWIDLDAYDYCFLEIPALLSGNTPIHIFKEIDISILSVWAKRSWKPADKKALQILEKYNFPIAMVLNGVSKYAVENQIQEDEMEQGKFKATIKRMLRFEFQRNHTSKLASI